MEFECEVLQQAPQPALAIRLRTAVQNLPRHLGESYQAIGAYLHELGEEPAGPPFVAYYNTDMKDLDVAIGIPVSKALPGKGPVAAHEIPGGAQAACLFVGPYAEMEPAYEALAEFVQEAGLLPSGVAYEFYLTDPDKVPLENAETRIVYPLS